ncbi:MAG: hypothetical protein U9Q82_03645 [Chloroflexota bacterium]|nr:hypothetical protein [Chloroflexota bacterium]
MSRKANSRSFPISDKAWQALIKAADAVHYNLNDTTVYKLRLRLHTPGIFSLYKADIPVPGLPMLDGFLKFLAFRRAATEVISGHPSLSNEVLWQWNSALRDKTRWINFPIPIRSETLIADVEIFDCSIGLPVSQRGGVLYPAGAFFSRRGNLVTYPSEEDGPADQLALRRRSVEPLCRPLELNGKLRSSSGSRKALNNRIYYALTREYIFYFRGDKDGINTLLDFALKNNIGLGKKTTLGYGKLAEFSVAATNRTATLAQPLGIHGLNYLALLKNIPQVEIKRRCVRKGGDFVPLGLLKQGEWEQNKRLFGVEEISVASPIETYDRYQPPYWRREGRTQVLRYGTLFLPRSK